MNHIFEKIKEVFSTLFPVLLLVIVLTATIAHVAPEVNIRFYIGSVMLLVGLSIFLYGVDLSMTPIGNYMSMEVATSKSPFKIGFLGFLLGFLITVAEPDLLILGSQIETASGGVLPALLIVYVVSFGVGLLVALGVFRVLLNKSYHVFMAFFYGLFAVLSIFVSSEFLAIAFDASGATTGALTTPFALALSLGLSSVKGGKHARENSFGLVGVMSAGPILAVMLMSIISGQQNIQGEVAAYTFAQGIMQPLVHEFPTIFTESLTALLPITILFLFFNVIKFKISFDSLGTIIKGLVLSLIGLTLFLTAAHYGFMDMGRAIGIALAGMNKWILIGVGFLIGLIVVLVEPAVHVLGKQIRDVTGGSIPVSLIKLTLSLAVGLAIAFSMMRIVFPTVQLWFFLLPGFALAVLLSFKADPIFVSIAYDAGGVASGPMTATFVLAFAQGAASMIESANVLVDGFGVIAMVAMAPVLSLMILGTVFRNKKTVHPFSQADTHSADDTTINLQMKDRCILATTKLGFAQNLVDCARIHGATGATIIHARGYDAQSHVYLPMLGIEIQEEKEVVIFISPQEKSEAIIQGLLSNTELTETAQVEIYESPSEALTKTLTAAL